MSMLSHSSNPAWRKSLLQQFQARNKQTEPFESVIQTCVSLFERIDSIQREKNLAISNQDVSSSSGTIISTTSSSTTSLLAQNIEKISTLQTELKENQKLLQEKDATINDLNLKISTLTKQKNELKSKNNDLEINIDAMKSKCQSYQEMINDLKEQNTLLSDEHTALQIAYNSLNNQFQQQEIQLNQLIGRWKAMKTKEADFMNEENEKQLRLKNEKTRKQLEEDCQKMVVSSATIKEMNLMKIPREKEIYHQLLDYPIPQKQSFYFEAHNEIFAFKFDQKTNNLISGGGDRKVKIWSLDDMKATLVEVLTGSNASVTAIDIFEEYLVASSSDHASRVWTLNEYRLRRTLTGHSNKVMSVKFMDVNNKVVSGSYDKTIKIWDLNRNACMRTFFAGSSCSDLVNIQENNIASAHIDKKIRFWDSRSDSMITDIMLQGKITSLDRTNDNHYLLCSVRYVETLNCFDLRMNQVVRDFTAESFNLGCDWTRLKLSPNNQFVACGSNDGTIFFWDFQTGKLERTLHNDRHSAAVIAVEWHPKGDSFASADRNKNIVIWS
ncbi:Autophagy-related protein 16-1 [Sarcoptes scabiei]|uniref:Autophagy-related protein 16-1 n=1 Tax=Sarcoptes scabiei TaxID=52283 RepID=A0A834VBK8_SARSC|nr:Autophagy-related protein 16-1 [Sarcoptes scabiei]